MHPNLNRRPQGWQARILFDNPHVRGKNRKSLQNLTIEWFWKHFQTNLNMYDLKKNLVESWNWMWICRIIYSFMIVFQTSPFIYLAVIFQMASDCVRVSFNSIHINSCNCFLLSKVNQHWKMRIWPSQVLITPWTL